MRFSCEIKIFNSYHIVTFSFKQTQYLFYLLSIFTENIDNIDVSISSQSTKTDARVNNYLRDITSRRMNVAITQSRHHRNIVRTLAERIKSRTGSVFRHNTFFRANTSYLVSSERLVFVRY